MNAGLARRCAAYASYLCRRTEALKGECMRVKLPPFTRKELAERVRAECPGVAFSNVARDLRVLTSPGEDYNPELDLLWRTQRLPELMVRYSKRMLSELIKGVIAPDQLDTRLSEAMAPRELPGGRKAWEEL